MDLEKIMQIYTLENCMDLMVKFKIWCDKNRWEKYEFVDRWVKESTMYWYDGKFNEKPKGTGCWKSPATTEEVLGIFFEDFISI